MLTARTMMPTLPLLLVLLTACDPDKEDVDTGEVTDSGDTDDTDTTPDDIDGDGFGAAEDCDDNDATIHPDAPELCDGFDNDCDGAIDDADDSVDLSGAETYYADSDSDGYGAADGAAACEQPSGTVTQGGDCDDTDAAISPDAIEICDGLDNDCDTLIDDEDDSTDLKTTGTTTYLDTDADGYGDPTSGVLGCDILSGTVTDNTDCDDSNDAIYPTAPELCNGVDDDCDPTSREQDTASLSDVPYTDLQDALDAATFGDTVELCDGTFIGAFTVPDGVSLVGVNGMASTILEGDGLGTSTVTLDGAANFTDLTFLNGSGIYGGAIDGYSNSPVGDVSIDSCTFDTNTAVFGGALLIDPSNDLYLTDAVFVDNTALGSSGSSYVGSGGAIYAGNIDIQTSTFTTNGTLYGGALFVDGGQVTIDADTVFSENYATTVTEEEGGYGGAIYALSADIVSDFTTAFSGNTAYYGGGVFCCEDCTVEGGIMDGNLATWGGGAYLRGSSTSSIAAAWLVSNEAAYGGGLFLYGAEGGSFSVSELTMETNVADYSGGGMFIHESSDTLLDALVFDANEAAESGGGLLAQEGSTIDLLSSDFYDNYATTGGGIYLVDSELLADTCLIEANYATDSGGGAYLGEASLLESDATSWGTTSDNSPDDVYIGALEEAYDDYGASESFTCDDEGCE